MAVASSWKTKNRQPIRGLASLAVIVLLGLIALVAAIAFLWPGSIASQGRVFDVGYLNAIPLREPVYHKDGNFWLVKLDNRTVLALSAIDSHIRHCTVPWRPDFVFNGSTGWFRDPCSGSTYDLAGNKIYGPAPRGLARYEVRLESGISGRGGKVLVVVGEPHLSAGVDARIPAAATPVRP